MGDLLDQGSEMLAAAGSHNISPSESKQAPGLDIYEMGGVRMGRGEKTSMTNRYNQLHTCNNVFVIDVPALLRLVIKICL